MPDIINGLIKNVKEQQERIMRLVPGRRHPSPVRHDFGGPGKAAGLVERVGTFITDKTAGLGDRLSDRTPEIRGARENDLIGAEACCRIFTPPIIIVGRQQFQADYDAYVAGLAGAALDPTAVEWIKVGAFESMLTSAGYANFADFEGSFSDLNVASKQQWRNSIMTVAEDVFNATGATDDEKNRDALVKAFEDLTFEAPVGHPREGALERIRGRMADEETGTTWRVGFNRHNGETRRAKNSHYKLVQNLRDMKRQYLILAGLDPDHDDIHNAYINDELDKFVASECIKKLKAEYKNKEHFDNLAVSRGKITAFRAKWARKFNEFMDRGRTFTKIFKKCALLAGTIAMPAITLAIGGGVGAFAGLAFVASVKKLYRSGWGHGTKNASDKLYDKLQEKAEKANRHHGGDAMDNLVRFAERVSKSNRNRRFGSFIVTAAGAQKFNEIFGVNGILNHMPGYNRLADATKDLLRHIPGVNRLPWFDEAGDAGTGDVPVDTGGVNADPSNIPVIGNVIDYEPWFGEGMDFGPWGWGTHEGAFYNIRELWETGNPTPWGWAERVLGTNNPAAIKGFLNEITNNPNFVDRDARFMKLNDTLFAPRSIIEKYRAYLALTGQLTLTPEVASQYTLAA